MSRVSLDFTHELYKRIATSLSCGYCGEVTTIESEFTCSVCGRMLCDKCGNRWGFCKDHIPSCGHPELRPAMWDEPRPEPAEMIGTCKHNMSCPICGFGWAQAPDPCDD